MRTLCLTLLIIPFLSSVTLAAEGEISIPATPADFSELKQANAVTVDTVVDALTLRLKDGTFVRLAGLDIPQFVYPEPGEISLKAKAALDSLFQEQPDIILFQTKAPKTGRVNRLGQSLAHVKTQKEDIWVQGYLLAHGFARAAPTPSNPEMTVQMLKLEDTARAKKTGLWAQGAHPVLTPETALNANGSFAVVEGTVVGAASVKNNLYLNFGQNWREDFTVMIPPAVRKMMVRVGIDPLALAGKTIRVRGWVREYNGALIELDHPASLELLPAPSSPLKEALQPPMVEP